jgi:uncharacterized protein (DUF1330 family)
MTTDADDRPFTLAFIGHADAADAERASAYEDEVLVLLDDHGARLLYRGRRAAGQDAALPLEVHLIWFPHHAAFDAYMSDARRLALKERYGDVFSTTEVVVLETLAGDAAMDSSG